MKRKKKYLEGAKEISAGTLTYIGAMVPLSIAGEHTLGLIFVSEHLRHDLKTEDINNLSSDCFVQLPWALASTVNWSSPGHIMDPTGFQKALETFPNSLANSVSAASILYSIR